MRLVALLIQQARGFSHSLEELSRIQYQILDTLSWYDALLFEQMIELNFLVTNLYKKALEGIGHCRLEEVEESGPSLSEKLTILEEQVDRTNLDLVCTSVWYQLGVTKIH